MGCELNDRTNHTKSGFKVVAGYPLRNSKCQSSGFELRRENCVADTNAEGEEMMISVVRDSKKRICSVCHRNIVKGKSIVKFTEVIDGWGNERMWFGHLDCVIKKLTNLRKQIEARTQKIPEIKFEIKRHRDESCFEVKP